MIQCLCDLNWTALSAVFTAISAIATAIMAYFTYKSIINSKEQLDEMRKQWELSNRVIIEPSIVIPPYCQTESSLGLQIKNLGKEVTKVSKIQFDDDFVKMFGNEEIEKQIEFICSQKYNIAPNESICLTLCDIRKTSKGFELFGRVIDDKTYIGIVEALMNFKVCVCCYYDGGKTERTFTNFDRTHYIRTIQHELSDISFHLSNIENKITI